MRTASRHGSREFPHDSRSPRTFKVQARGSNEFKKIDVVEQLFKGFSVVACSDFNSRALQVGKLHQNILFAKTFQIKSWKWKHFGQLQAGTWNLSKPQSSGSLVLNLCEETFPSTCPPCRHVVRENKTRFQLEASGAANELRMILKLQSPGKS